MQSLCPDGQRDEFGFLQYKNSTVTQLLERISEVVEQNRLFTSDRPGLGQDLETLQQHLESLSAAPLPPDYGFNSSSQGLTHFSFTFTNNKLPSFPSRTGFLLLEQVQVFSQSSALRTNTHASH
ncbi:ATP-binding cassette sub-family A member 2-like [Poecilia formosa]|uniref:ATP-binding cassette sub-family A member 2-like n=1 Tax=Poecilia formosa TaxID=48698 RepID=UPI0007B7FE11|nr:PREDICTED: ATP-binding cassette sub-family A member 2-like [Poecilia formosa]